MNENNEKFYCLVLSSGQLQFLTDPLQGKSRCACLFSLVEQASEENIVGNDGLYEIRSGDVKVSKLQLADQWAINRKTVDKMIEHFNKQGLITTSSTTKGSAHTLRFLSGWITADGQVKKNPNYKRPTPNPSAKEPATVSRGSEQIVAHVDNGQTSFDNGTPDSTHGGGKVAHTDNREDSTNMNSNALQP